MTDEKLPPPYQPPTKIEPPVVVTTPTVIIQPKSPGVVITQALGPDASRAFCRSCNEEVITLVKSRPTTKTHLFAGLLCLVGCWLCVCIPYCMKSCKNIDHYCPNCNTYIGSYV